MLQIGPPACLGAPDVGWIRAETHDRPQLDLWCATVGPAVRHSVDDDTATVRQLIVVSWNVHVGAGRVPEVLARIRANAPDNTGVVLLLQETYRAGDEVPAAIRDDAAVPRTIDHRRRGVDVRALAEELRLNLVYVPSMRNGRRQEDRGNAILSTEPLTDAMAIELPFGKQRRVAVMATVVPRGGVQGPLQVVSAHLDTNGARVEQGAGLFDYLLSTRDGGTPLIVGADLNALYGTKDAVFTTLADRIAVEACGSGSTHTLLRARLDFMFSTLSDARSCRTLRDAHGSDHRPLVLTIRSEAEPAGAAADPATSRSRRSGGSFGG